MPKPSTQAVLSIRVLPTAQALVLTAGQRQRKRGSSSTRQDRRLAIASGWRSFAPTSQDGAAKIAPPIPPNRSITAMLRGIQLRERVQPYRAWRTKLRVSLLVNTEVP